MSFTVTAKKLHLKIYVPTLGVRGDWQSIKDYNTPDELRRGLDNGEFTLDEIKSGSKARFYMGAKRIGIMLLKQILKN